MKAERKIKTKEELIKIAEGLRKNKKKIVTCNGCFDIIHAGHIKFLEEAKEQGDILIVGLNSDSSVKANKGKQRPINTEKNRAIVLGALEMVDYVVIFPEKTPIELLEIIKPDIHANGAEYGETCIEAPTVKKHGGRTYLIKKFQGLSTTDIIRKMSG